ncbi:integral membrane protein (TIGR01906 family) [Enterococcus sp. PF1-24]|uniref:TIGR01906 family membrane protein n=1 Tax=unclassified Enterococcus TaxID=2608891 RepID=UPI0024760910|nr:MULTISPECIES: TIGR01906 family membrane protein [unclassified Enterococcus]MDH6365365.1 integral membrane protein (TIGR01906 family) [Enterococcus sp. PFB1-1]MDH6402466.1 integral membrane protein (TIGR01906 family) [Enterococcus sp. PF1-24]
MTKEKLKNTLQWLCLFLAIISLTVAITINFRPLYIFDVDYLDILAYTDLDKGQLLDNFGKLMSFLNNPFEDTLQLADFPMSASGLQHFIDVKKLFLLDYGVLIITIIPALLFVKKLVTTKSLWRLIQPFQVGMVLPLVLGFVMAIGFDRFFTTFHEVLFGNDDWIFNPATDPIINVLPAEFFMHYFVLFFVLLEAIFLIGIVAGRRQLKKKKLA